jgi:hypothetical protein
MDPADAAIVRRQLGRPPRGSIRVSVRCPEGAPAVIETSPTLEDGTPFPTRFWLSCPALCAAVARAEAVAGWSAGRAGPHRNCLHREVAEALAEEGETAAKESERSREALDVIAGWECADPARCAAGEAEARP